MPEKSEPEETQKGPRRIEYEDWVAEARARYNSRDEMSFVCPICGHVATVADYQEAGAHEEAMGFSCIGRFQESTKRAFSSGSDAVKPGEGPCDYTLGGFFSFPATIVIAPDGKEIPVFEWGPATKAEAPTHFVFHTRRDPVQTVKITVTWSVNDGSIGGNEFDIEVDLDPLWIFDGDMDAAIEDAMGVIDESIRHDFNEKVSWGLDESTVKAQIREALEGTGRGPDDEEDTDAAER